MAKTDSYVCVYCGNKFIDFGNNPDSWNGFEWQDDDKCCNECNYNIVIPGRIKSMQRMSNLEKQILNGEYGNLH